jgi:hypothetical protein
MELLPEEDIALRWKTKQCADEESRANKNKSAACTKQQQQ